MVVVVTMLVPTAMMAAPIMTPVAPMRSPVVRPVMSGAVPMATVMIADRLNG